MPSERKKIVSDAGFIDSIRNLGLTTTDAVNEFIDNSFDHYAKNIWITIHDNNGKLSMTIEDDGEGIPPNVIMNALAFGGRLCVNRITTGKFGWGLSSGACCQSPRTELFSKINKNYFYYNYIDLNELKNTEGYLPPTIKKNPFNEYKKLHLNKKTKSGTIILLKHLDQAERKTLKSLEHLLTNNLSIVQRKFISSGKNIYINNVKVKFHDPLMLEDGSLGIKESGKGEIYAKVEPIIYKNIKDQKGKPAKIDIKISKLPVKTITEKKLQRKEPFNISPDNQGFYLMRHGRQIAGGQTLHLFARHPTLNYFRGEINFEPCLDSKFGIQTNKSRFSLDEDLRNELNKMLSNIITQLRIDIEAEETECRRSQQEPTLGPSLSEIIADKVRKKLKPSGYKPTKEEIERAKKDLEKTKKDAIRKIKQNPKFSDDKKKDLISNIEMAFQKERTFLKVIDIIGTGEFYQMKHKGKIIEVIINQGHGFYKKIYERATQDPYLVVLLDLFIFTLALAEDIYFDNEDVKDFYEIQRREWSSIMSQFLNEAKKELEENK
jgi:hypothetical protein